MRRQIRYRKIILVADHVVDERGWKFPLIVPTPTPHIFEANAGKHIPRKIHLLPLLFSPTTVTSPTEELESALTVASGSGSLLFRKR